MVDDLFEGDDKDLQDAVKWVRYYLDRGKSVALLIATSFSPVARADLVKTLNAGGQSPTSPQSHGNVGNWVPVKPGEHVPDAKSYLPQPAILEIAISSSI
jgi:hypothetical protein